MTTRDFDFLFAPAESYTRPAALRKPAAISVPSRLDSVRRFFLDRADAAAYIQSITLASVHEPMNSRLSRRSFLAEGVTGISSLWVSTHWTALLSASAHARQAAKSAAPPRFEFFTQEEGLEIDAIAARIIPTTDTPGAREAGVVYFIDRALVTFSTDNQKTIRDGLPDLEARVRELFPGTGQFSAASPEQQDQVLQSLDEEQSAQAGRRGLRSRQAAQSFFETLRVHTLAGFLIDPESEKLGNRDGVGWRVIGRDPSHMFQPPFGYYDKDYPGFQISSSGENKANS